MVKRTQRGSRRVSSATRAVALVLALAAAAPVALAAAERDGDAPMQLDTALKLPRWLHMFFTQRTRFEFLQNQFRPVAPGNDRALALRTTLLTEFRFRKVAFGVEIADSRLYLQESDTPLNDTLINPVDFLQAYVDLFVPGALAEGANLRLRAGRQTLDLGGRRLVARNRFRNTINSFSGLDVEWVSRKQDTARLFVTAPVRRRPTVYDALAGNEVEYDSELSSTLFWGLFYGSRPWSASLGAEAYVLGIHESDEDDEPTRNRDFLTSGCRFFRVEAPGRVDFELEAAIQFGTSRRTSLPADTTDLRHRAFFLHGAVGRTFSSAWRPRLVLMYDYASGDETPFDETNEAFDTLFGARRFELGPTGIYGALGRSNLQSPSVRLDVRPHSRILAAVAYRPAWLAQARDFWSTTGIRDPSGSSGTFLGHQIEGAARWWLLPGNLMLEAGFAYLRLGGFPKQAPNGIPDAGNPLYGYVQLGFQI